jgi:hypothetical protein
MIKAGPEPLIEDADWILLSKMNTLLPLVLLLLQRHQVFGNNDV